MCINNVDAPFYRASKWLVVSNVVLVLYALLAVINYFTGFLTVQIGSDDTSWPEVAEWLYAVRPFEQHAVSGPIRNPTPYNKYSYGAPEEPVVEVGLLICLLTVVAASAAASCMFARLFSRIRSQEVSGKPPQLPTRSQLLTPVLLSSYSSLVLIALSFWFLISIFVSLVGMWRFITDDIVSGLIAVVLTTASGYSSILSVRMSVYTMRGVFANVYRDPPVPESAELSKSAHRTVMLAGALMCLTAVLVLVDAVMQSVPDTMAAAFVPLLLQIPAVWCSALLRWRWRRRMVYVAYALLALYPLCLTAWHWALANGSQVYCYYWSSWDCTEDGKLKDDADVPSWFDDASRTPEERAAACASEYQQYLNCVNNAGHPSWVLLIIISVIGTVAWLLALVGLRMVARSDSELCELSGSLPTSNESLEQLRAMRDVVAMQGARNLGSLPRMGGAGRVVEARSGGSRSRKVTPDRRVRKVSSRSSGMRRS